MNRSKGNTQIFMHTYIYIHTNGHTNTYKYRHTYFYKHIMCYSSQIVKIVINPCGIKLLWQLAVFSELQKLSTYKVISKSIPNF